MSARVAVVAAVTEWRRRVRAIGRDTGSYRQCAHEIDVALASIGVATGVGLWRLVILESPYAGDIEKNVAYARAAMRDCLRLGDAPAASHLLYTQPGVLDDADPDQRALGIDAGLAWGSAASATVVYADLGISRGMHAGIERAEGEGRPVEYRRLEAWRCSRFIEK